MYLLFAPALVAALLILILAIKSTFFAPKERPMLEQIEEAGHARRWHRFYDNLGKRPVTERE